MRTTIIDRFNNGEVHFQDGACGWLFDNGEFRPLMNDALKELWDAELITRRVMKRTEELREQYEQAFLNQYINHRMENGYTAEERYEMRAAFGPGEVVDVITGKTIEV